jgi:molybdenum storage protein
MFLSAGRSSLFPHFPKMGARALMKKDQDDLTIERPRLEILQNSEVLERITIINDLEEGNITCALNGENAWTVIYKKCPTI